MFKNENEQSFSRPELNIKVIYCNHTAAGKFLKSLNLHYL